MAKLLSTSKFCIKEESVELQERKETKETLGYVPRPRTAADKKKIWRKDAKRDALETYCSRLDEME